MDLVNEFGAVGLDFNCSVGYYDSKLDLYGIFQSHSSWNLTI